MTAPTFRVGDLVRVGTGRKVWRVARLWRSHQGGEQLATLEPVEGYSGTTVAVGRLRAAT